MQRSSVSLVSHPLPALGLMLFAHACGGTLHTPPAQPVAAPAAQSAPSAAPSVPVAAPEAATPAVASSPEPPASIGTGVAAIGSSDPNAALLPPGFRYGGRPVHVNSQMISLPGCYVACYARRAEGAAYSVGDGIFVHGLVRVSGRYGGRVCRPENYETADISAAPVFAQICQSAVPSCAAGGCWAGGDTGGFLGL